MRVKRRSLGGLGQSGTNFVPGSSVNLSFQLSGPAQAYFSSPILLSSFTGGFLATIQGVVSGMSVFSSGEYTLNNAQWDNSTLPSVLTLTVTAGPDGAQYAQTAIAAAIADTLNNYYNNVGTVPFTPVGMAGAGTVSPLSAVASAVTLNPVTLLTADWNLLTTGSMNPSAAPPPPGSPAPLPTWVWILAGAGVLAAVAFS